MQYIKNVSLFGELTDIGFENGKITHVGKCAEAGRDFGGAKIFPGLIDVHSHGAIGIDTMYADFERLARFYLENGTTTWYPTTMTMPFGDIMKSAGAKTVFNGGANIPGFHLEGPFINVKYKGAQNPSYVHDLDFSLLEACPTAKLITIAPELEGAEEFIKKAKAAGVVVCLGHTDADYDTAMKAFAAGADCLTHTYNAMPGIHHRNPGPIAAGADAGAYAQLISDGKHVHPSAVRLLVKLYGPDKVVLISDSVEAAKMPDGEYKLGGLDVVVNEGTVRTREGALAGSSSTLLDCVRCAISFGIPEEDAFKMASETPARLMGLNKGKIEVGYDADFIITDESYNLITAAAMGNFCK
ncbi:MAG: N-acetylglucosamine-6-phosphate deacetylase [Clostridia bacterium]|nr:N-acetylglucosamine-6-phosphate deacetylase [Clostridia bacterium]